MKDLAAVLAVRLLFHTTRRSLSYVDLAAQGPTASRLHHFTPPESVVPSKGTSMETSGAYTLPSTSQLKNLKFSGKLSCGYSLECRLLSAFCQKSETKYGYRTKKSIGMSILLLMKEIF